MAQLHSTLTANHRPYAAVYADATERLAATGFVRALGGGIVAFTADDLYKTVLQLDNASEWVLTAITPTWVQVGTGNVVGPGSATDNALVRFDSTTGKLIQNSTVTLDDTGALTVPEMAAPSTPGANKVAIYAKADGKLYIKDDAGTETDLTATGSGTIGGSTGATDNRALRADGTGGATVQSSNLSIPDDAATTEIGYLNIPQNSQSTNYTAVLADRGWHLFHPVGDNNPRTFTIPANSSVAFPVGTAITFANKINVLSIAITTDTLTWAQDGSTGTRALAANGIATALKITSTEWLISGTGLS
jgi:hypothetical protein